MGLRGHWLVSYCLVVLLWLTQAVAAAAASEREMSGDCQETCGNNVSIPYPFGIGKEGCYFPNSWFEVICIDKRPFLKRLKLELLYSYSDSIVVNNPVIYFNCGNDSKSVDNNIVTAAGAFTDIPADSPFSFSSVNSFGSAGYGGNLATIFENQIPISGCLQPGYGNGDYCYISGSGTPENLTYLGAKMTQIFPVAKESNRCSSAFLFDQYSAYSDVLPPVSINVDTRKVPARLNWNTTGLRCDLKDCKEPGAESDRVVCNKSRCGDAVIEFPFGTKAGCYMNEWFKVTCNKTGQKEKAFLDKINLEVLNTSFSEGTVLVNHPKTYSKCHHEHNSLGFSVNLTGSPFFFSSRDNYFAYLGCGSLATLFDNQTVPIGGCLKANCSNIGTSSSSSLVPSPCYELSIPPNLGSFAANMTQIYPSNDINGSNKSYCPSAFIIDYRYTDETSVSDYNIINGMHVPSTLQFGMQKSGICELKEGSDTKCSHDDKYCWSKLPPMHLCVCTYWYYNDTNYNGYTSAYGIDVCREAGKCKNRKYKMCYMLCVNEPGNYCSPTSCPNGYAYDKTQKECKPKDKSSKESAILIGCSTSFGTLFLLLATWCLYKVVKRRQKIKRKQRYFKKNGGLLLQQQLSSNDGNVEIIRFFASKELEKATDRYNENRILGRGGQGTVYKGMLADGRIVAIKKSKRISDDDKKKKNQSLDHEKHVEQWVNEVMILSQINHRNVVKLLGCCLETQFPLLVYEFIPNGTLFQMIHDNTEEFPLTWRMRLQIAIDVANALSYLHSAASVPIYHRDVKSTNILLDDKYRAKVSDFGISKSIALEQTHLTTRVQGTFGYLDPEYFRSNQFTEKSDVYSFGVVLVELLTGRKPFSFTDSGEEVRSLVPVFLLSIKQSSLFDILDRHVMTDGPNEEIIAVAKLAKRCLNLNGKKRPTMKQVAMELEWIRAPGEDNSIIPQISDVEQDSEDDDAEPWSISNTASSSTTLISKQFYQ